MNDATLKHGLYLSFNILFLEIEVAIRTNIDGFRVR